MKLQLALITAVLAVSTTVAQAADTRTPDILGSVSGESVQALSKADAKQARGQYYVYKNDTYVRTIYTPWKMPKRMGSYTFVEPNGYDGWYYISR